MNEVMGVKRAKQKADAGKNNSKRQHARVARGRQRSSAKQRERQDKVIGNEEREPKKNGEEVRNDLQQKKCHVQRAADSETNTHGHKR